MSSAHSTKRVRFEAASNTADIEDSEDSEEAPAKVRLEQLERDIQKHQDRESVFYKSLIDKARGLITDAKKEAESILAGAVKEAAEKTALVQDAEKKAEVILSGAEAILAGAAEEKQKWEAEKKAEKETMSKVQHFEPIVKLDVGGVRVTTSLTTLRRFPDTMMGCMFSGRHTLAKGEDGYFFIDRDGKHFHHILTFLRSPESYEMELEGVQARELRRECEYYCLDELMFHRGTEKTLKYYDLNSRPMEQGLIGVLVNRVGVHTINGEKIEYCTSCHGAFFNFGMRRLFFPHFDAESPPAAQPRVQGCYNCA
jgi:hypothetical protein